MKTILDFDFSNKTALIRVDFNVPLDSNLEVIDNTRILSAKPTILKVLKDGGSCVLMSHLGRPKGIQANLSLGNIVSEIEKALERKILFIWGQAFRQFRVLIKMVQLSITMQLTKQTYR